MRQRQEDSIWIARGKSSPEFQIEASFSRLADPCEAVDRKRAGGRIKMSSVLDEVPPLTI